MLYNAKDIVDAFEGGRSLSSHFRKSCGLASAAGSWVDFSMTGGNPPGNFYASVPLVAARLDPWSSLFYGPPVISPYERYLTNVVLVTPSTACIGCWKLCDFLLYYPFVDLDDIDVQTMTNTVALDRYTNGEGVHAILVAQAPTVGGGTFQFTYTNQSGVEQTSSVHTCSSSSTNYGSIITSLAATTATGMWLRPLQGDTGIRNIVSWKNLTPNGGLGAIVLIKPLTNIILTEIDVPTEKEFLINNNLLPRIYDNAFLGYIMSCAASVASSLITGKFNFIWK